MDIEEATILDLFEQLGKRVDALVIAGIYHDETDNPHDYFFKTTGNTMNTLGLVQYAQQCAKDIIDNVNEKSQFDKLNFPEGD